MIEDRETEIGVIGGARSAAVGRTGVVAPHAAGWELDWWIGADDRWHIPAREAAVRSQLVDGMPVVQTAMRVPGGDAVQRVYAAPVPDVGEVAVVEIANESPAPFVAALVLRGANRVDLGDTTVYADGRSAVRTHASAVALGDGGGRHDRGDRHQRRGVRRALRVPTGPRRPARRRLPLPDRAPHHAAGGGGAGTRGLGEVDVAALPGADAVARGLAGPARPGPPGRAARPGAAGGGRRRAPGDGARRAGVEGRPGCGRGARGLGARRGGRDGVVRFDRSRAPPHRPARTRPDSWARVRELARRGRRRRFLAAVRDVVVVDGDATVVAAR